MNLPGRKLDTQSNNKGTTMKTFYEKPEVEEIKFELIDNVMGDWDPSTSGGHDEIPGEDVVIPF